MTELSANRPTLEQVVAALVSAGESEANVRGILREAVAVDETLKVYRPGEQLPCREYFVELSNDAFRSDFSLYAGGITWVDREYDERLHPLNFQLEVMQVELNAWFAANALAVTWPLSATALQHQAGESPKGGAGGTATTNRTEARIAAIVETARQFGYDPLSVPYGGKAAIERECLDKLAADPCRFTSDTFKSAWQAARDAQQIDVQNAETYRGQ